MSRRPEQRRPPRGLLGQILLAPDRDQGPGVRPVVSVQPDDDPELLAELEERGARRVQLVRRGVDHGTWAELDPEGIAPPISRRAELKSARAWRWHAGRPVLLPGLASATVEELKDELAARARLGETLDQPGALRDWIESRAAALAPDFELDARPGAPGTPGAPGAAGADAERDLERVRLRGRVAGERADDLWIKTTRLSDRPDDRSRRLRVSFGREVDDDDSDDEPRHRLVAALAARLLPELPRLAVLPELERLLRTLLGGPALLTQPIVYWNAPGGGALFHHDSFRPEPGGQRGVLYAQLTGATAWLALSIVDLAERVAEFLDAQDADPPDGLAPDPGALVAELALPGCGRLGGLVNRGPEFTGFLADAGHGLVLRPGDALLLPDHGLVRTAMHSVFCASEETGVGLSAAIRAAAPA